jgi:hypothetical protein
MWEEKKRNICYLWIGGKKNQKFLQEPTHTKKKSSDFDIENKK